MSAAQLRVLVTGASGMLGGAVAAALVERGHHVTTFQRRASNVAGAQDVRGSLADPQAVTAAVSGQDAVIHLAAKVSVSGPAAEFERVNVAGTQRLLTAARASGVSRFVYVSSPSVAHVGQPLVGVGADLAQPRRARGHYARTKAQAELLALAADAPDFAVVAIRPHTVWGPGDTQLIERILARARAGRLPLLGWGAALIDTTYVSNAADALVAALDRAATVHGQALVVSNGEPRTVAELLHGICVAGGVIPPNWRIPAVVAKAAGAVTEAVWALRPGVDEPPMTRFLAEQLSTAHWFDQRRTRELLQWQPRVSIDDGLRRLSDHYGPDLQ